ncbi:hypothetical protein [Thermogymnomonas acidicola]|uniref:thiamine pyrophosphate-binding protein n=1 Tax=Thermogymnomonas acidicola TaxID=399579 RepID=UPI000946210E|nr:thiamine pyrophosphate-binding protein [Thermogymnomonas acidicola]
MIGHRNLSESLKNLGLLPPIAGNPPGTTEIPALRDIDDYILCLHDSIAVGVAEGMYLADGRPRVASLHTMPGLGNSMAFINTARANGSPPWS